MMTHMSNRSRVLVGPFPHFLRGNSPRILLVCMAVGCGIFCTTWRLGTNHLYLECHRRQGLRVRRLTGRPRAPHRQPPIFCSLPMAAPMRVTRRAPPNHRSCFACRTVQRLRCSRPRWPPCPSTARAATENLSIAAASTLNLGGRHGLTLGFLTTNSQRGNIAGTLGLTGTTNYVYHNGHHYGYRRKRIGELSQRFCRRYGCESAVSLVFGGLRYHRHARNAGRFHGHVECGIQLGDYGDCQYGAHTLTGTYGNLHLNCTARTPRRTASAKCHYGGR